MNSRLRIAALIVVMGSSPALGDATLTFTAPAVATPPSMTAANGNVFVPYTAALVGINSWNTALADTLTAQSFTPEMGWLYGNYTNGPTNPVTLANNAVFNVKTYALSLNPADKNEGGETMDFMLNLGATQAPTLAGATVTPHWLQLIHENPQTNDFGYSIPALGGGYWLLDNGEVSNNTGTAGPFYDSNNPMPPTTVPPRLFDFPHWYDANPGVYVQFWSIMAWDVQDGSQNYLVVSNQALFWGFYVAPEPSSLALGALGMAIVAGARAVRGLRAARGGGIGRSAERVE